MTKISFWARKRSIKPVKVRFKAHGKKVSFVARKSLVKRVKVQFRR